MVAAPRHVVEIRPLERARRRGVEQQAVHIAARARVAGRGDEAVQSTDHCRVAILVNGHQPRAHERCIASRSPVNGPRRDAEEHRYRRATQVQRLRPPPSTAEDLIDHRLDDRMRLVAEQQLEDGEVTSSEAQ